MKYAFFVLVLSFSFSISASVANRTRTITSFNDSPAIMTIAQFIADNADDLPVSNRLSDKKLKVKNPAACEEVSAEVVFKEVQMAIKSVLRMFPDEELPIEEAMSDLADYIGNSPLKKCSLMQMNDRKKQAVSYYFDATDTIHIKVDTITLLSL